MIIAYLASAAVAAQPGALTCNGQEVTNINSATMVHVRLQEPGQGETLATSDGIAAALAPSEHAAAAAFALPNGGAPYGYSRLKIEFTPCDAEQRDVVAEKRHFIQRLFVGKKADKVLKLKVTVKPLGVSSSTTLTSMHRNSGKSGEEWVTEVDNDGILLPYFRVDSNSLVRVEADFESTRQYNSSISADVLEIIKRASALISPTAPLITAQNKDRFNDAATFVDSSVSGLLKVSIKEKPGFTVALTPNGKDQEIAVVTLVAPWANDTYPSARAPLRAIGQWRIVAEKVRPSMLGNSDGNGGVTAGSYTASAVMNFGVAEGKTLKEALAGSSSVSAARDALIAAANDKAKDPGRSFCRTVASEIDGLGLAPLDVGIGTWAALTDLALPDGKMTAALEGCRSIEKFPVSTASTGS